MSRKFLVHLDFVDYTNEMFSNYRMQLDKLIADPDMEIVRPRRPGQDKRFAELKQKERMLTNGHLTPKQFIKLNSHSADGLIGKVN